MIKIANSRTTDTQVGFLVDNYFITNEIMNLFVATKKIGNSSGLSIEQGVYDIRTKNFSVKGNTYKNFETIIDRKHINELVKFFKLNELPLKRYIYVRTKQSDIKETTLNKFWHIAKFEFIYSIYDTKLGEFVGYLLTSDSIYNDLVNIHMCMFEVLKKKQGVGTQIIRELLKYKPIRGYTTENTKGFFNKLGVKYLSDNAHFVLE